MTSFARQSCLGQVGAYLQLSRIISAVSRTPARKFAVTRIAMARNCLSSVGLERAAVVVVTACDFALLARDRGLLRDKPASVLQVQRWWWQDG
jgi:hypothetical protein